MRIVKKGNKNTTRIAYKSLVRPILEDGAACWDPYRECQINTLDRVQNKWAKFVYHTGGLDWESLVQRVCMCVHVCACVSSSTRVLVKGRGKL
jgi:hypothetical protein